MEIKRIIYALSVLSGTIIGVGFFSLPYITSKVGILVMLGYFLILGALVILVHLFFGELALQTPDFKRLPGFAKFHLGNWGKILAYTSTILGLFGAILAYLIVGSEFLENLLSPFFKGPSFLYIFLYFSLGAILIYFGTRPIAKVEFGGLILFFVILFLIFFQTKSFINIENLFLIENWKLNIENFFLPYGPILFSLWGASLIPEVEEMLREDKKLFKKIIFFSILIPILIYLFFIFLILGITGSQTTESAITGLRNFTGAGIFNLGLFFGVLTTFTSFIALGLTLKKVFCYDLKIKEYPAWLITCFIPLILFLFGVNRFIPVISFIGGVLLGIDGILILLMYHKLQVKTTYPPTALPPFGRAPRQKSKVKSLLIYPLILIFLGGIIYEIIYFAR